jgi:hypothetical protein
MATTFGTRGIRPRANSARAAASTPEAVAAAFSNALCNQGTGHAEYG